MTNDDTLALMLGASRPHPQGWRAEELFAQMGRYRRIFALRSR